MDRTASATDIEIPPAKREIGGLGWIPDEGCRRLYQSKEAITPVARCLLPIPRFEIGLSHSAFQISTPGGPVHKTLRCAFWVFTKLQLLWAHLPCCLLRGVSGELLTCLLIRVDPCSSVANIYSLGFRV